jgi:predicted Zn-dependent protease
MSSEQFSPLPPPYIVVEQGLAAAQPLDAVVIVEESFDADVRFANNTTTTNGVRRSRGVTVAVFVDQTTGTSVGIASKSGLVDVAELVELARDRARASGPASDASPLISETAPSADFELPAVETDLALFGGLIGDLGEVFGEAKASDRVLAGFIQHEVTTTYLGTSRGVRLRHAQPTGSFELVARSTSGDASSWVGLGTEDFSDVHVPTVHQHLIDRLIKSQRKIELPAGRYEVIMPPEATADLVIELLGAMSGRDGEDGGTVFSGAKGETRVGERLTELAFDLSSDPATSGIACDPFLVATGSSSDVSVFDNGVHLNNTKWIDGGVLSRLRYHRAGAKRSGKPFSPPIGNLSLSLPGSNASLADLIAGSKRALLLTCLWYIREVDPATLLLTGLTRDGVYLVEDGEIVGAVNNFRFNESPLDMLGRVSEAGATTRALSREWGEWMNRTTMPPLRVADFNMSSVSKAS